MCGKGLFLETVSSLMTVVWGKGGTLPVECVVGVYFSRLCPALCLWFGVKGVHYL